MNMGYQILATSARRFALRPALLGQWGEYSYGQLEMRVARLAGGLVRLGIRPGDRVAFMMNNHPDVVIAYFAILRIGAIAVAANVMLKRDELAYLLNDSETGTIICESVAVDSVMAAGKQTPSLKNIVLAGDAHRDDLVTIKALEAGEPLPEVVDRAPDDVAMMLYTSGTTGSPRA